MTKIRMFAEEQFEDAILAVVAKYKDDIGLIDIADCLQFILDGLNEALDDEDND